MNSRERNTEYDNPNVKQSRMFWSNVFEKNSRL